MRSPVEVLTEAELDQLLDAMSSRSPTAKRQRAIVLLMAHAGCRRSEVAALDMEHLDLDTGIIKIRQSKRAAGRNVHLTSRLRLALEAWLAVKPPSQALCCTLTTRRGVASGNPIGSRITDDTVDNAIRGAAKRAGLGNIGPRVARHTFATLCLQKWGLSIREVQVQLGHRNIATTMIYTHVFDAEVAAKLNAVQ